MVSTRLRDGRNEINEHSMESKVNSNNRDEMN